MPKIVMVGLLIVVSANAWLAWRELRVASVTDTEIAPVPSRELDVFRKKLAGLREQHARLCAAGTPDRLKKTASLFAEIQTWAQEAALGLGTVFPTERLRDSNRESVVPEARFVSYSRGVSHTRLVEWHSRAGKRALFTFESEYSDPDIPSRTFRSVQEGGAFGEFQLVYENSPTRPGATRHEVIKVSPRGRQTGRTITLPSFRVIELFLASRADPSNQLVLEVPYSEEDRRRAEKSEYKFREQVELEVPLATLALRDDPSGAVRKLTTKEGSVFDFAGKQHIVKSIRPDHIFVSLVEKPEETQKWSRRDEQDL